MAKVNREELLAMLESVQPGLSAKDELEQSSCVAFKDGYAFSYNGELACRAKSILNGVEGAVHAGPLVSVLKKMPEEEVEVTLGKNNEDESHLIVTGIGKKRKRELGVRMDAQITMPLDQIEPAGKWSKLPEDFADALKTVQECAGVGKKHEFVNTCVHLTPNYMEAFDNRQMIRYRIATGVTANTLIKQSAASHVAVHGARAISESPSFLHFKTPAGVVVSCRRFVDEYKELTQFFADMSGEEVSLPKSLAEELDNAEEFSSEEADNNLVRVVLKNGRVEVKGQGVTGYYIARSTVQYEGKLMTFFVPPGLLRQIVARHAKLRITQDKIKVKGGSWRYVAALTVEEKNEITEE